MTGDAVLVHGAWSCPQDWRWVEELLVDRGVTVRALDLPSHRRSDATRADDVEHVARAIAAGSGPTVAVGWSYGGSVLTDLDLTGLAVARLVYVSSIPGLPPSQEPQPPPGPDPDLTHVVFGDDGTMVLDDEWFLTSDPAVATMPAAVVEHLRSHPRRSVALAALIAEPTRAAWRDVDTVVLLGRDDDLVGDRQRRWVDDQLRDVRVVDSDHFVLFRRPDLVADSVTEALS